MILDGRLMKEAYMNTVCGARKEPLNPCLSAIGRTMVRKAFHHEPTADLLDMI
jgi:hypothetical protein